MSLDWRSAFLLQGQSDIGVFDRLIRQECIERCHCLHYLQMACEKVAKGLAGQKGSDEPPRIHDTLLMWLKVAEIRCGTGLMSLCGCISKVHFKAYLKSLESLADAIDALAPAVAGRRGLGVNVEYPWRNPSSGNIYYPANYSFSGFAFRDPKMVKLLAFIKASIQFGNLRK